MFELFRSTIRNINIRDYSEAQVRAWASDEIFPSIWVEKIRTIAPFVVESNNEIVGYSDLQDSGLIDHFFVHCQSQGVGVGRALMGEIERRRIEKGLSRLESHVSITARPFFEVFGFVVLRKQQVEMRGEGLTNYVMERRAKCT
ncbi:MAG: GNAT family N-acetyltransferase [Oceanococcus sp.]